MRSLSDQLHEGRALSRKELAEARVRWEEDRLDLLKYQETAVSVCEMGGRGRGGVKEKGGAIACIAGNGRRVHSYLFHDSRGKFFHNMICVL